MGTATMLQKLEILFLVLCLSNTFSSVHWSTLSFPISVVVQQHHVPMSNIRHRHLSHLPPSSSPISHYRKIYQPFTNTKRTCVICMGTINYKGESRSKIRFTLPPPETNKSNNLMQQQQQQQQRYDISQKRTLPHFLQQSASDLTLLGGTFNDCHYNEDTDLWEVKQAPISWFGAKLTPTFIHRIDRISSSSSSSSSSYHDNKDNDSHPHVVTVSIVDSYTQVDVPDENHPQKRRGGANLLKDIMDKRSSFQGGSRYSYHKDDSCSSSWIVSAELTLTLTIELPRAILLPPGFNTIGSAIVRRTCKSRVQQSLEDMRKGYLDWAMATNSI